MSVDSILLPRTPHEVRHAYLTLAERAREVTFGLLEEDIVMLDTETTGLSYRKNELIEIAAARISGRSVVERFQTFVHPSGPIPAQIVELTGIRDIDVADAPTSIDAVGQLADFVGGQPIVAHNASFDRAFVEEVAGGMDVSDVWIDSLALSRIALPRLRTHRLADMAQAFGCPHVTHRAMDDVDALCEMWRILLLALTDLPAGLLERLGSMHEGKEWQYRTIMKNLAEYKPATSFSLSNTRRIMGNRQSGRRRQDARDGNIYARVPSEHEIDEAFTAGGLVDSLYDAYESRPEQVQMAREVREALETSTFRCIEAGTGVGKSMAYLVPAVLFAQMNNVTVGVATKTNALTDQLVSHEVPALASVMPNGLEVTSLKGADHYPCMRKLDNAVRGELPVNLEQADIAEDVLTAIAAIHAYACQSVDGDLDALGIRWRNVPRDLLTSTSRECIRRRCPYFPQGCFMHGARMRAHCSDVVITNHALLLRDIDADNALLPPIRHWIVDEAHSFGDEARRQWAAEVSADEVMHVLSQLGGVEQGIIQSVIVSSSKMDSATLVAGIMTKAASWVRRSKSATQEFFDAVHGLVGLAGFGGYESTSLWIDTHMRESDDWAQVESTCDILVLNLEETVKTLSSAAEILSAEDGQHDAELHDPLRRLRSAIDALRIIVLEPDEAYVYSAELQKGRKRIGDSLQAQLLSVAPSLVQRWYPEVQTVVYSSATLAVGTSFEHFEREVGLDQMPSQNRTCVQLASSFDYENNMMVVVAKDLPAPNDRRYLSSLEDLLYDIHVAMDGSVLTLFTNRREMERVYEGLHMRLGEKGIKLLCQQRGVSPRRLKEQFVTDQRTSLVALKSFWEGFDAVGSTLRCVVVCKLPFANPRAPLVREREMRDSRAWWRYSLPEAVLEVKQAAGRLIRSADDKGVFVIADSRVAHKRYGNTFIKAMPTSNYVSLGSGQVTRFLGLWRASHER